MSNICIIGVQRAAQVELKHARFVQQLKEPIENVVKNRLIRSKLHQLFTLEFDKRALCAYDDKRFLLSDGISSLSYGHYKIEQHITVIEPTVPKEEVITARKAALRHNPPQNPMQEIEAEDENAGVDPVRFTLETRVHQALVRPSQTAARPLQKHPLLVDHIMQYIRGQVNEHPEHEKITTAEMNEICDQARRIVFLKEIAEIKLKKRISNQIENLILDQQEDTEADPENVDYIDLTD